MDREERGRRERAIWFPKQCELRGTVTLATAVGTAAVSGWYREGLSNLILLQEDSFCFFLLHWQAEGFAVCLIVAVTLSCIILLESEDTDSETAALSVKQAWVGGVESNFWWTAAVHRSHAIGAKKEVVTEESDTSLFNVLFSKGNYFNGLVIQICNCCRELI